MELIKQVVACDIFRIIVDLLGVGSAVVSFVALHRIKKVNKAIEETKTEVESEVRLRKLSKYLTQQSKKIIEHCNGLLAFLDREAEQASANNWQGFELLLPKAVASVVDFIENLDRYDAKDEKIYEPLQKHMLELVELAGRGGLPQAQLREEWAYNTRCALNKILVKINGLLETEGDFHEHI